MKKDAYYFPHDYNARNDPKIIVMINAVGLEGYAIYWILIEMLREQPDYKLPVKVLPGIAGQYRTTDHKVNAVVSKFGLFEVDENQCFFSPSLCARMRKYDVRKIQAREAIEARWEKQRQKKALESGLNTDVLRTNYDRNTIRVDKSKVNKSKKEDNNINTSFEFFWDLYNYKVDKKRAFRYWKKIPESEHQKIFDFIPRYLETQTEKRYLKHPATFLYNESWKNELPKSNQPVTLTIEDFKE